MAELAMTIANCENVYFLVVHEILDLNKTILIYF